MSLGAVAPLRADLIAGPPIRVSNTAFTEEQPSVAAHGDSLVAVWGKSRGTPVAWGYSLDGGRNWTSVGTLLPGGSLESFRGPPTLCADSAGTFYLAVKLATFSGWTTAILRGSFNGSSLAWVRLTNATPYVVSIYDFGPDHMQIVCDLSGVPLYLAYIDASGAEGTVKLVRSLDGGQSWSTPLVLSGNRCNSSRAALGPDGELYVMWHDEMLGQLVGRKSVDRGVSFGAPFVVGTVEHNLTQPVGWYEGNDSRDYPDCRFDQPLLMSLAVDRSSTATRGRVYVTWSERASGTPKSLTGTRNEVEPNNGPATATPMLIGEAASGSMFGQEPKIGDCDWFTFEGVAGQTLWITGQVCGRVSNGDPLERWSYVLWCGDPASLPLSGQETRCAGSCPALVYTLPASGRYYLDLACTGSSLVNYTLEVHEFEVAPTSVARDHRDIVLAASGDGGLSWSPKVRVSDVVGYEEAMPGVAVDGAGRVHVAWYDRREDPECSARVHTRWSHSEDGGASFGSSVRLSDTAVDLEAIRALDGNSNPWVVGDHLSVEAIGDEVQVYWAQPRPRSGSDNANPGGDIWSAIVTDDVVTATLVAGFWAKAAGEGVRLHWRMHEEAGVQGFQLYRAEGNGNDYQPIGERVPARGVRDYEQEDAAAVPGTHYRYRLEVVLESGSAWQGPLEVDVPPAAEQLRWQGASPNPFTEIIVLELAVVRPGTGRVAVYDLSGHEVRRMTVSLPQAGVHSIRWDGRDRRGRMVPAGIYLVRATVGGVAATRRVVRID